MNLTLSRVFNKWELCQQLSKQYFGHLNATWGAITRFMNEVTSKKASWEHSRHDNATQGKITNFDKGKRGKTSRIWMLT